LGHAPTGTRRTKPAAFAAEGQQQLLVAGVTAQSEKAMGENAALQVIIKFALDIGGQALRVRIGVEGGEKGLQMVCDNMIEYGLTRIAWDIHRW
jgi:hypothetical protein